MKTPRPNLEGLRRDRDQALARSLEGMRMVKQRLGELDGHLASFTGEHPLLALGGAAVAGGAAALIAPPPMLARITQIVRVLFLGPIIDDALQQVSWVLGANPGQPPPSNDEPTSTTGGL